MMNGKKGGAYAKLEKQEKKLEMQEDKLEERKKAAKAVEMEKMIRSIVRSEVSRAMGKKGK